jgi:RNA polymerase sigma-70 factor (ECF subfamily)
MEDHDSSRDWISALRGAAGVREQALERLHHLLLRATRFELSRRREQLDVAVSELDELATQAADDALMAILQKLDDFNCVSRFTTWACKFALAEAGRRARVRAWQQAEVALAERTWPTIRASDPPARDPLEDGDLPSGLRDAVRSSLTPHQRDVFSELALNGIPIDVLAERRSTTRQALYETLHGARGKLRAALAETGHPLDANAAVGAGP